MGNCNDFSIHLALILTLIIVALMTMCAHSPTPTIAGMGIVMMLMMKMIVDDEKELDDIERNQLLRKGDNEESLTKDLDEMMKAATATVSA